MPHTHTIFKTIFHTQLCHAPSFTHNFVTHHLSYNNFVTHNLLHNNFVTHTKSFTQQLCNTHTHTIFQNNLSHTHTTLSHTIFQTTSFCAAGVPLMTLGWLWWPAWPLVARRAAALCVAGVAGVALAHIHLRFSVADVALGDINLRFARVGSGGALGPRYSPAAPRHFAWQARHLATSTFVLRGRTALGWLWWRAWAPLFARGGAALGDIDLRFAWQLWHLLTSTFVLRGRRGPYDIGLALVARFGAVSCPRRRGTLRGRRGTWRHRPSLCVAVVALLNDFEVANLEVNKKTRRKTSIFEANYKVLKLEDVSHEMLVLMLQRVSSRVSGFPVASPCLWGSRL